MKRFLLNIARCKIHNGYSPCHCAKRIAESNKKWFDRYVEVENYYEGESKKGVICSLCFKDKEQALEFEKQYSKF